MSSAKIILYKSKKLKDGTHPIMIQITHQRRTKRVSLSKSCLEDEWDKASSRFNRTYKNYKRENNILTQYESRLVEVLNWFDGQGIPFTIQRFVDKFGRKSKSKNVIECFDEIADRLGSEGRLGNRKIYKDTKNSLIGFIGKGLISFADLDYGFLKRYESYLRSNGSEDSGIHLRLRTIRAVFNEAIKLGYVSDDLYPFSSHGGKKGYSLSHLKLQYKPRSLSAEERTLLKSFDLSKHKHLATSYLLFMFSYYSNGINFADLAKLKWSNIHNDQRIIYKRQKTNKFQDLELSGNIRNILSHFKPNKSAYIFPILDSEKHINATSIYNRVKKCLKIYNKDLKEIQAIVGIETQLTSYTARHSYAMALRENGTRQDIISHLLGHADVKTTEHYLSLLDNSYYDRANDCL